MIDPAELKKVLKARRGKVEDEQYYELMKKEPEKIEWVTKSKARWVVAMNPTTMYKTTSDMFSSEMAVYNFPIGLTNMSVPKRMLPADYMVHLMYSLEWLGADVRPEEKYRKLRRPGVIELIFG